MWWGKMFSTDSCLSEPSGHLFWLEFLRPPPPPLDSEVTPGFFLDASTNPLSVILLPLYAVLSWPGPQWVLQCIKGKMCFMAIRYWYSRASGDPLQIQQSSLLRKAFLKKNFFFHSNYFCESWGLRSQDHRVWHQTAVKFWLSHLLVVWSWSSYCSLAFLICKMERRILAP